MKIVWDPEKAKANYKKHGVWFSDAEPVLFDPYALTVQDDFCQNGDSCRGGSV